MKMKSFLKLFVFCGLLTFTSCASYKKVPYLQHHEYVNNIDEEVTLYDAKIMPKDVLSILVTTSDPESSKPFNIYQRANGGSGVSNMSNSSNSLTSYLVNNDGTIEMPIIGTINVLGLTKTECENLIKEKLQVYLKETPLVTVRMAAFTITVLGEVNGGGQYTIAREKVNILEALAMAGDLTVYGRRDNVKLLREDARGKRHIYTIDITDASLVYNPLYQLQQNDILYVTPMKVKAKNSYYSANTSVYYQTVSLITSLTSVGLLLWNIFKK